MHATIKSQDKARERAYSVPLDKIDVSDPELFRDYTFWPYFEQTPKRRPGALLQREHVRAVLVGDQI